jgi:YD repeat-containing protein
MLRRSVHPHAVYLASLVQAVSLVLIFAAVTRGQSIVNVYDELGRLIAIIHPSGDVARYAYDAAGNLLSISRSSSSSVSVIHLTPNHGPVGTVVTIYGTGFSTTPSQNTVTFNGVTATVTSSSATQIVTSVPSSATTGTIGITSPSGSASSATSFTVTANTAPTITSFTPTIGATGTSVSISGTNFETTAASNGTKFNTTYASVSSATSTSISTSVPSFGGSGKITVATPNGSATSADDFFVLPSGISASDVSVTGRMISGESKTVTISSANKVGMILFDGVAGQRPYIKVTSSSISITTLSIYNPKNIQVNSNVVGTSGGLLDGSMFSSTGTYAILVDPSSTNTGSITFTLYLSTDYSSTISANGSGVGVTTTTAGQNARLNFNATANQRVYLKITSVSMSGGTNNWVTVTINKLDGTSLASTTVDSSGGAINTLDLPAAGTYYVYANPTNASTGTATLTLYDVPADVTGTISTDGSSLTATTTALGQNAKYTISGTASQRVYLQISSVSLSGGSPNWANVVIKKPDGTNLISTTVSSSGYIDTTTLPSTGSHTVLVDPLNTSLGSMTLKLYDVPADDTGTITAGGSASTVTTTTSGQNGSRTFSGTANQRISLRITGVSVTGNSWVTIVIRNPNGSQLTSTTVDSSGGFIDTKTLATTGTYTIFVDPYQSNTGSVTLTLYDVPADDNTTTTVNASAVGLTTTVPGQNAWVTFSGTSSTQLTVRVTNNGMSIVTVKLLKPDGSQLTSSTSSSSSFNLSTQTLPTTGTYKVTVDANGTSTGSINVAVTNP